MLIRESHWHRISNNLKNIFKYHKFYSKNISKYHIFKKLIKNKKSHILNKNKIFFKKYFLLKKKLGGS